MASYPGQYLHNHSMSSSIMNLAYQDLDGYPNLVEEIEDTISRRNQSRIQDTMRHFELMSSRNNKAMGKHVYDDIDGDRYKFCQTHDQDNYYCRECCKGHPHCIEVSHGPPLREDYRYHRSRRCLSNYQNIDPSLSDSRLRCPKHRTGRALSKPRWEIDPRTGEWVKVYDSSFYGYSGYHTSFESDALRSYPPQGKVSYYGRLKHRSGSPKQVHSIETNRYCNCRHCIKSRK